MYTAPPRLWGPRDGSSQGLVPTRQALCPLSPRPAVDFVSISRSSIFSAPTRSPYVRGDPHSRCRPVPEVGGTAGRWVELMGRALTGGLQTWAPSTLKGTHGASYAPTGQLQPPNLAVGFCLQIPSHPKEEPGTPTLLHTVQVALRTRKGSRVPQTWGRGERGHHTARDFKDSPPRLHLYPQGPA